jgi:hypothetical protein
MTPEQAEELGCDQCVWFRPSRVACGYIFSGQIIDESVEGVLICNKKKPFGRPAAQGEGEG